MNALRVWLAASGVWIGTVAAAAEGAPCEEVPISYAKALVYPDKPAGPDATPIELGAGPHLFVDDYLIASSQNIERVIQTPARNSSFPNPIVTGKEDGCFQPYLSVLRNEETGRFRMWFGRRTEDSNSVRSRIGYLESADGIRWARPVRVLEDPGPIQFGVSVIDSGASGALAAERFKFAWYMDGGLRVAASPDGLTWKALTQEPVLRHNHDITSVFFDTLRKRYTATVSVYREGGPWEGKRRVTMQSHSPDLVHWGPAHHVLLPDPAREKGEVQFYAMDGFLQRGNLLVGMVKVLRDDLKADDPPEPPDAYGIGYTALAWSRDGETWVRDLLPFFERNPEKDAWDHSHAWIDEQVQAGDSIYLYYGGYAHGHKVNRFEERQIGLAITPQDRYVARRANGAAGILRTPPVRLNATDLRINVEAVNGTVRTRILDEHGNALPGFDHAGNTPISGDHVQAPVVWRRPLSDLQGKLVQVEFELTRASLFAFYL